MAEALRQELLLVPGIAGAEVESDQGVAGVRVQLAVGADAGEVGAAVRRILAEHGMNPVVDPDHGGDGPPPPPGAPGSVVSFPLVGEHARSEDSDEPKMVVQVSLEGVAVEETPSGMSVSVRRSDGRWVERVLDDSGIGGMDDAIVAAVAELRDHGQVSLAELSVATLGEQPVVTVLLSAGEKTAVGSAIQRGGHGYALARATWLALDQLR